MSGECQGTNGWCIEHASIWDPKFKRCGKVLEEARDRKGKK